MVLLYLSIYHYSQSFFDATEKLYCKCVSGSFYIRTCLLPLDCKMARSEVVFAFLNVMPLATIHFRGVSWPSNSGLLQLCWMDLVCHLKLEEMSCPHPFWWSFGFSMHWSALLQLRKNGILEMNPQWGKWKFPYTH